MSFRSEVVPASDEFERSLLLHLCSLVEDIVKTAPDETRTVDLQIRTKVSLVLDVTLFDVNPGKKTAEDLDRIVQGLILSVRSVKSRLVYPGIVKTNSIEREEI